MSQDELNYRFQRKSDWNKTLDRSGYTIRQGLEYELYPTAELGDFARSQELASRTAMHLSRLLQALLDRHVITREQAAHIIGDGWSYEDKQEK